MALLFFKLVIYIEMKTNEDISVQINLPSGKCHSTVCSWGIIASLEVTDAVLASLSDFKWLSFREYAFFSASLIAVIHSEWFKAVDDLCLRKEKQLKTIPNLHNCMPNRSTNFHQITIDERLFDFCHRPLLIYHFHNNNRIPFRRNFSFKKSKIICNPITR